LKENPAEIDMEISLYNDTKFIDIVEMMNNLKGNKNFYGL